MGWGRGDGLKGASHVTGLAHLVGALHGAVPSLEIVSVVPLWAGHRQVLGPSSLLESARLGPGFNGLYQPPRPRFSL